MPGFDVGRRIEPLVIWVIRGGAQVPAAALVDVLVGKGVRPADLLFDGACGLGCCCSIAVNFTAGEAHDVVVQPLGVWAVVGLLGLVRDDRVVVVVVVVGASAAFELEFCVPDESTDVQV